MLEELQATYDLVVYDRDARTMAPDEYKTLSPLGTAPVMTCGDLALAESSAIMEFILDRTPGQNLADPLTGSHTLFVLVACGTGLNDAFAADEDRHHNLTKTPALFHEALRQALHKGLDELFIEPRLSRILAMAEKDLGTAPWFGGSSSRRRIS